MNIIIHEMFTKLKEKYRIKETTKIKKEDSGGVWGRVWMGGGVMGRGRVASEGLPGEV